MAAEPARTVRVVRTMGTVFSLDVRGPATERVGAALDAAGAWLEHVDEVFSTYRPQSQISRLAAGTLALSRCSPEVWEVMRLCEAAERRTRGYFSARYAGGPGFDPTGLVKGWAVERAAAMLAASGADAVCVNGGGDVQTHGGPWRIGLAHPLVRGALAGVVLAPPGASLAVATSGAAERGPHILDPRTGRPPAEPPASLTVVSRSLTDADVHATAGYAMGAAARSWLESLPGTEAQAVTPSGEVWTTSGFPPPA
ncbi:FAD:protein FMN transferase [Streptomyces sp. NPDC020983]|uniref:FAD:protein FMN transferase n=1 Tax=Streptomyces sp. NPDC020983 TaxID=3365106 RepID=UPI0037A9C8FA